MWEQISQEATCHDQIPAHHGPHSKINPIVSFIASGKCTAVKESGCDGAKKPQRQKVVQTPMSCKKKKLKKKRNVFQGQEKHYA
jgi:hypothetical protein